MLSLTSNFGLGLAKFEKISANSRQIGYALFDFEEQNSLDNFYFHKLVTVSIFDKKMKAILFAVFLLAFTFSCTEDSNNASAETPTRDLTQALQGTWEAKYLKIEVDSYQGQDSSFVFEVSEETWEQEYSVKPFRTFFAADSTFRTTRRSINNNLIGEDRGLWRTFGDTLMLLQPNNTSQYKVVLDKGQAEWAGVIDWDLDGVEDDVYYATYRYVGRTPNE